MKYNSLESPADTQTREALVMTDTVLLPDLITHSATRSPNSIALSYGKQSMCYADLQQAIDGFVGGILGPVSYTHLDVYKRQPIPR